MTCFLDFITTAILLHSFRSSCSYLYIYEKMVPTASPNCGSVSSIGQIGPTAFWLIYSVLLGHSFTNIKADAAMQTWTELLAWISLSLPGHHHFFIHEKEWKIFKRQQNHFTAIIHHGEDRGGGHRLVRMEWCPAVWLVCLPLLIFPWTIKSRSSLLAPAHPGGPGKRSVKWLWCGVVWYTPCVKIRKTPNACSNSINWTNFQNLSL